MALTPPLLIGPDRLGRSVAVVNGLVAATAPPDAKRLPCPQGEIESGAVCAHTHLYSGLARYGMPPATPAPETFLQILERVWWRLDRALDADILRASALDYVARALLAGTTTLVDHHESPNLIEEHEPEGPFGAKGIGELGLVPTAGAVAAALEAFDGVRRMTLPMKDSPAARAIDVGRIKDSDRDQWH